MLAEIAAANAAFSVIKAALANGKELSALGSRVFDYFDNKAKIQEKATQKGGGSDLEEFMALEQLKLQGEGAKPKTQPPARPSGAGKNLNSLPNTSPSAWPQSSWRRS